MEIFCQKCGYQEMYEKQLATGKTVTLQCQGCGSATKFIPGEQTERTKEEVGVRWYNSLQIRFCGALLLATLFIGGGFMAFEYYSAKKQISTTLHSLAEISAIRMSKYLVEPLWGLEEEQLSESLTSEMLDREIQSIVIHERNPDSMLLAKIRGTNGQVVAMNQKVQPGEISNKKPITRNGNVIGDVEVTVTDQYALSKLSDSILRLSLATVILCVVLLASVILILRNLIISPIQRVMDAADQISTGAINAKIDYSSNTEIGLLVESIKRMQASFAIAYKMIQKKRR